MSDVATLELVARLRAKNDQDSEDAASLILWFVDTRADFVEALKQEREDREHFQRSADAQTALLVRLHDHLKTLSDFAMGFIPDPMPEPPQKRKGQRA